MLGVASLSQPTVPSRDLAALASTFKFDAVAVCALSNTRVPAAKASVSAAALTRSDAALTNLCNYSALQAAAGNAHTLVPRLVEGWKRCFDAELVSRHAAERDRDDSAVANVSSLEERANLVREWEAYSQHWEQRGREAERVITEWEKAHKCVVKEYADVRGQLDSTKAYLTAIGHGAASISRTGGAVPGAGASPILSRT